jgi:ribosome-binding protein aMBF1 (putative translation factor)
MQKFPNYKRDTYVTTSYDEMITGLIDRRNQLGISQEGLAFTIGCTPSLIHKWEQYKRVPSGFMFACWVEALGCQIEISAKDIESSNISL